MTERETLERQCPYCGEVVEIVVDARGAEEERYTEDCSVCCRPWDVVIRRDGETVDVELLRDDE